MKTRVVIVGGGTAGWLTAGIIAAKHCLEKSTGKSTENTLTQETEVILVESPDVKNLGVGEGTWPTMRDTLRQIGISERTFLSCCDAVCWLLCWLFVGPLFLSIASPLPLYHLSM